MSDFLRPLGFVLSILAAALLIALLATAVAGGGLAIELWNRPTFWAYLALGFAVIGIALFAIRYRLDTES